MKLKHPERILGHTEGYKEGKAQAIKEFKEKLLKDIKKEGLMSYDYLRCKIDKTSQEIK